MTERAGRKAIGQKVEINRDGLDESPFDRVPVKLLIQKPFDGLTQQDGIIESRWQGIV
ncbi:hypothetical protein [Consotaella aegiceratis]|uniref:hypothetical protein n=1 Tax=Consotaella aegiceratis TaxID=3097961 RepID=UPI002F42EE3D